MRFLRSSFQYPLAPVMPLTCVGVPKKAVLPSNKPETSYNGRVQLSKTHVNIADSSLVGVEGAADVIAILKAHPTIHHLTLGNNQFGDDGSTALFDWLSSPQAAHLEITEISMNSCHIGNSGFNALTRYLAGNGKTTLKALYLQHNKFNPSWTSISHFTLALNGSRVSILSLNSNKQLGDVFIFRFLPNLNTSYLRELHLSAMGITPVSTPILMKFLTSDRALKLKPVIAKAGDASRPGGTAVVEHTLVETRVRDLRLNANELNLQCIRKLVRTLESHNFSLIHLEIFANRFNFNDGSSSPTSPVSSSPGNNPFGAYGSRADGTSPIEDDEDDESDGGETTSSGWQSYNTALVHIFARNRILTSKTGVAALKLLTPARLLLLPPSWQHGAESKRDPDIFPWRRLPSELQHYILSLASTNLSPRQHVQIWKYAASRDTLPSTADSRPSTPPLSQPAPFKSEVMTAGGRREAKREEWLRKVGCDHFDWYPGWVGSFARS